MKTESSSTNPTRFFKVSLELRTETFEDFSIPHLLTFIELSKSHWRPHFETSALTLWEYLFRSPKNKIRIYSSKMSTRTKEAPGPDQAAGWLIAMACFFINFICAGLARTAGVLYVALIELYGVSREAATTPFSIRVCVRNMTGKVTNISKVMVVVFCTFDIFQLQLTNILLFINIYYIDVKIRRAYSFSNVWKFTMYSAVKNENILAPYLHFSRFF